jgi:hypothetical protein
MPELGESTLPQRPLLWADMASSMIEFIFTDVIAGASSESTASRTVAGSLPLTGRVSLLPFFPEVMDPVRSLKLKRSATSLSRKLLSIQSSTSHQTLPMLVATAPDAP